MRTLILTLCVILALGTYCYAGANAEEVGSNTNVSKMKNIRAALQDSQFEMATKLIDSLLDTADEDRDFLFYLKGLSLFYKKDFSDAIKSCQQVIRDHEESPWYRKAIFLKAQCHMQLMQFEEAEKIYEAEARRLLSAARKEEIAGVYFRFAEAVSRKPGKDELDAPPPNYQKAYELYKKALELEIGRDLKDEIMFRLGRMMHLTGNHGQAINDYRQYLAEFDPDWMGPVDSPRRQKKTAGVIKPGKHIHEARYYLAECLLASNQARWARINIEDLLKLTSQQSADAPSKLLRDAQFMLIRTYHIPGPRSEEDLALGVKAARKFAADFPGDSRAMPLPFEIGQSYQHMGRSEEAIEAYKGFLKAEYREPVYEQEEDESGESHAERFLRLRMLATYTIGDILRSQKNYAGAIEMWNQYVAQFPNGPQWTDAQQGIINAEFQTGIDLLADEKYDEAVTALDKFLARHPLDGRSRQIMFIYGQMHYHAAEEQRKKTETSEGGQGEYRKAISEWDKLVKKYPNTEESSLALFRMGQIYEDKLGELEKALESYRKLTWGRWHNNAQNRIRAMTDKKLELATERVFRTNEPQRVKVLLRNIEKLTVNIYKLDLEAYWRKIHGIEEVENLDIALIAPDETWEYEVPDYQKYKPFEQYIEIPMEAAGVYAVNVGEEDLEATTLVIRSDIDAIIKTSRQEVLVFAEDMLKKEPAPGARVLISDGAKLISEGVTGEDGVFHKTLDGLRDVSKATIFVVKDGSVASNAMDIGGLGLSSGLTSRGYIYSDKPTYRPGEEVSIRGIIRGVSAGSYSVSPGVFYEISIMDSQSRLLHSEKLKLSKFGTFNMEITLDENAPVGEYRITAELARDAEAVETAVSPDIFTGTFQVQRYKLEKMKLAIEFPQRVYFRGEKVVVTFTASYYYGQPVVGRLIRYTLPDGRSYTEETDADGKLKVEFDTTPMQPDMGLIFHGSIEGENVQVRDHVMLARLGFSIRVEPSEEVVISGEPFHVSVETTGADGKPVGKELTLTIYQRISERPHPILSQVPFFGVGGKPAGEVKVSEHQVITDEKTGKGQLDLNLEDGGTYILRAAGVDRFDQPVSGSDTVLISNDEDAVKLRIFAERTKLKVGEKGKVRIHSRLKPSLALLTYEGEGIIHYKVMQLEEGWNELEFGVGHEHFPNFHLAIAMIDSERTEPGPLPLRTAGKDFTVERQLMVSLKVKEFYRPGEEAQVEVIATDQLGKPVEAELSLALVDEALFAIYPDNLQPITDFFNEGIHRDAAMRTVSSCTFRYKAKTRRVLKELLEEVRRLEMEEDFDRDRGDVLGDLNGIVADEMLSYSLGKTVELEAAAMAPAFAQTVLADFANKKELAGGRQLANVAWHAASTEGLGRATGYYAMDAPGTSGLARSGLMEVAAREEFASAGYWLPAVVTDANGKATAKIPMPANTTQWRLTARGCTVETLVGQIKVNTITRKDFFVNVKLPSIFTEGDKARVLARVHNLTDFAGNVDLRLKLVTDSRIRESNERIRIQKNSTTEVVFDEMEITAGQEIRVEVAAQAGDMADAISRTIPIRPWGMEYGDSKGGVSSGDETVFLQLPRGYEYTSSRLTVSVKLSVRSLISDLAMNKGKVDDIAFASSIMPMPGDAGSDLLAVAYALAYLKQTGGGDTVDNRILMSYARNLTARLVVSQRDDGGWSWCSGSADSDIYTSSRTLWALAEARRQGVIIHSQTIEKATSYLKTAFTKSQQSDDDTKSVILHSLSTVGEADFAYANRLYRNRNTMGSSTLAYTALIFANLGRNEIGGEILDVLESKKLPFRGSGGPAIYWRGGGKRAWAANEVETSALALLAMEAIRPNSPLVKQAVEYLLSKRRFYGYSPHKVKGPVVAALAVYYGKTQFTRYDFSLKISVNGEEVESVKVRGAQPQMVIDVPTDLIKSGQNRVEFDLEGTGEYAYTATLSGFSPELKDPRSWDRPYILSRRYYHSPLEYKGRQIASSTSQISQLQDGERTYVSVDIREGSRDRYLVIHEYLPAGTMLVNDSISGNAQHYEVGDSMITFYYPPGRYIRDYKYQLVSYAPGSYRALPTVIGDVMRPGEMRMSKYTLLDVLAPGEKSKDVYKMNNAEYYGLGKAYFDDGEYADALPLLSKLQENSLTYNQREVARMLLWIYTEDSYYKADKVVEYFEVLRERFPELYIPFDKILVVGRAYKEIGESERAYLVYKATIDASFINDSNVSAVLEDEGQFLSSIDFQENLWREYPDSPQVTSSYFALSQAIYSKVPEVSQLAKAERQIPLLKDQSEPVSTRKITKLDLLKETVLMLAQFLTLYPGDPLADDACFSMANVFLDLEDFSTVVKLCRAAQKRYPKSEYLTSFQYVEALGFFSQREYGEAVEAAKVVANGKSKDRDLARYILGQIYHAQGKPETAIDWYKKVEKTYPDAQESISYFQEKRVSLDEVKVVRPDEDVKITIKYRNIKEASLQIYNVDLMKLYLREKDLSNIRSVHLAGIEPKVSETIALGDGKDYVDKEREVTLTLEEEGAYLIICRGDDLFTSGLVLITPLNIEVQEDAVSGRVRVNVRDMVEETYREGVHVKAVGSSEKVFRSGETDLRGLFIADDVRGKATIIARDGKTRYAFYRGEKWLGAPETARKAPQRRQVEKFKANYRANTELMNQAIQMDNVMLFDQMRRGVQKGVQVQQAY